MEKLATTPETHDKPSLDSLEFALSVVRWIQDKKGLNLRLYKVSETCSYADYIVICSGTSDRHISAIAEEVRTSAKKFSRSTIGAEGLSQKQWILLDFGDVIAHFFYEPVRDYYELDRLWGEQRVSPEDGSKVKSFAAANTDIDDDDDEDDIEA